MERFTLSRKEPKRLEVFGRAWRGELTLLKGAELAGLSCRQTKRACGRCREEGDAGLVHRLRDRASNRTPAATVREQAVELYRAR